MTTKKKPPAKTPPKFPYAPKGPPPKPKPPDPFLTDKPVGPNTSIGPVAKPLPKPSPTWQNLPGTSAVTGSPSLLHPVAPYTAPTGPTDAGSLGGQGGGASPPGTTAASGPGGTLTDQTAVGPAGIADVQQQFPQFAWMLTVPAIASDIINWASNGSTAAEVTAELQGTPWYQSLGANFFSFLSDQATGALTDAAGQPTGAGADFQQEVSALTATFSQMGLQPSSQQIQEMAYRGLAENWTANPELQRQAIADTIQANPDGTFSVKNFTVDAQGNQINVFTGTNGQNSVNAADFQTTLSNSYIQAGLVTQVATIGADGKMVGQNVSGGAPVYAEVNGQLVQGFDITKLAPGTALYTLPNFAPATGGTTTGELDSGLPGATQATGAPSAMAGGLQSDMQIAQQTAAEYMVPTSPQGLAQMVQQVVASGTTDVATYFKTYYQAQAKSLYPTMAASIDAGITPAAYMDPYKTIAANLLSVNPNSINMQDPQYMRAVTQKDPKTGAPTAMSLYDWQNTVMSDPQYGYMKSQSAVDRSSALVQGLGTMFGKSPGGGTGFSGAAAPAV